jgi:hypothetical protein
MLAPYQIIIFKKIVGLKRRKMLENIEPGRGGFVVNIHGAFLFVLVGWLCKNQGEYNAY